MNAASVVMVPTFNGNCFVKKYTTIHKLSSSDMPCLSKFSSVFQDLIDHHHSFPYPSRKTGRDSWLWSMRLTVSKVSDHMEKIGRMFFFINLFIYSLFTSCDPFFLGIFWLIYGVNQPIVSWSVIHIWLNCRWFQGHNGVKGDSYYDLVVSYNLFSGWFSSVFLTNFCEFGNQSQLLRNDVYLTWFVYMK